MNKQDSNGVRTAQDIERKYNFAQLLGLTKNVETNEKGLVMLQNTLNDMLNALVINLKDVLDSQSDVSLWFYSGVPTNNNLPYTSWITPSDHYGDIYYDTNEGKVYQFYESSGVWEVNANPDLLRAMALTNSEIDTSTDHERKVFFTTPTIPYSSGDWWILEDGTLKICQLGKSTGTYEEQDFIDSTNYTPTISEKFDDVIKVLKGTITTLSEDYVQFTDLATGGSTTIAGENIKTGVIQSNNYVANSRGMLINLSTGIIDTKNFKTDVNGNIIMGTGAKVIGGDGLLSNLEFDGIQSCDDGFSTNNSILKKVGFDGDYNGNIQNTYIDFYAYIPEAFKIEKAYVTLIHIPAKYDAYGVSFWCHGRNLKLGGATMDTSAFYDVKYGSDYANLSISMSEIKDNSNKNALSKSTSGYTAPTPTNSNHVSTIIISDNLMDNKYPIVLESGKLCLIRVYTSQSSPVSPPFDVMDPNQVKTLYEKNGHCIGKLNIYGYMPFSEESDS